jgi:Zn ribbon nucleic-acid-binding protein
VGSMDRPVWWDEETVAAAVHCMECTFAARSHYRYTVKLYFYKIDKKLHT